MSCCCGLMFWLKVIGVITILIVIYMKFLRKKIFAMFLNCFSRQLKQIVHPGKVELFEKAFQQVKRDNTRMKILEIGVGTGTNFKYYPENSEIIISDRTDEFVPYLKQSLKEMNREDLKIHDFIVNDAQNMSSIESNSVDAVVATLTLCSIDNLDAVFNEIYRVVKPGGVFIFMDHSKNMKNTKIRLLQTIIEPLWSIVFDGCRFRDIKTDFHKHSKFEFIEINEYHQCQNQLNFIIKPLFYGYAQKFKKISSK